MKSHSEKMLTVIFSLCVQSVTFRRPLTDGHVPSSYVLEHNGEGGHVVLEVKKTVEKSFLLHLTYHNLCGLSIVYDFYTLYYRPTSQCTVS